MRNRDKKPTAWHAWVFYIVVLLILLTWFHLAYEVQVPPLQVFHAPDVFTRRHRDFTANVTGSISSITRHAKYRINQSAWYDIVHDDLRAPEPFFTIELFDDQLREGSNSLEIQASTLNSYSDTTVSVEFRYDPTPISLPLLMNWEDPDLDVHDGHWERILTSDRTWRVRPKPKFEDYDRILVVSGAFSGGRRIETDVIFRYQVGRKPFGFGLIPLWGGAPDHRSVTPRRGWNFGMAWYYSLRDGVGVSYSHKHGGDAPRSFSKYEPFRPERNIRYHLVVEAWPEEDPQTKAVRYRQRMKWWSEQEPTPSNWIELTDEKDILPASGEFAVAIIAHRCQADFGPVVIEPLELDTEKNP